MSCRPWLRPAAAPSVWSFVRRSLSSTASSIAASSSSSYQTQSGGERLRIAIVGGGVAGMSTALHLAPLVARGLVTSPIDVYEESSSSARGRDIGVGLWNTALEPFRTAWHNSHQLLWEDMVLHYGRWVGNVGYKTPGGAWLAKSQLPTDNESAMTDLPGLLFLRQVDMMTSLQKALHLEQLQGTIQLYTGSDESRVIGIGEESTHSWSAPLALASGNTTERDYHLIVAADGMHSILRQKYGGHANVRNLTGMKGLPNPFHHQIANDHDVEWQTSSQADANAIEDRQYHVFRGNSNLTVAETGMDGVSFQTWGVGKSMRFATVPLSYPSPTTDTTRTEKQVWFITTSDASIAAEPNATKRREMLISPFSDWHPPIRQLLEATPPDEILVERALAHKHSVGPVLNMNDTLRHGRTHSPPSTGPGPAMVFIGDAFMTVDPILAQGFTVAMESAYQLALSVERSNSNVDTTNNSSNQNSDEQSLAFDPYELRQELMGHYEICNDRLLCLLRATELVQALGQPQSGLLGSVSQHILRPLMRVSPQVIKRPIFNAMLKYSLGLPSRK